MVRQAHHLSEVVEALWRDEKHGGEFTEPNLATSALTYLSDPELAEGEFRYDNALR